MLGVFKRHFLSLMFAILVGAVFAVMGTQYVSAEAGPGGGGGSTGCSTYNHSTCYGAVWRYYKTTNNNYPIKNVGSGYTYATGCSASGGFFAYVLPHKRKPHDPAGDMSWRIGSASGNWTDTSIYFGGYTNYRIYSQSTDPIVTNPVGGAEYSWYSVKKAFQEAVNRGQGNGYRWDRYSQLGWFCYSGVDYDLTPTITGTPKSTFGADTATLSPTVNNTKTSTSSNVDWQVVKFVVQPGVAVKSGGDSSSAPEQYFPNANIIKSGSQAFPKSITNLENINQDIDDYAVGTHICFALSLRPYSQSNNNWRHSNPFCIIVGVKPKVQVWGGDLVVGTNFINQTPSGTSSDVITGISTKVVGGERRAFGSWIEYGIFSTGAIRGAGSESTFNGPTGLSFSNPNDACSYSSLSFTNVDTGSALCINIGNYSAAQSIPDVSSSFPISSSTPRLNTAPVVNDITGGAGLNGTYTADGDVIISSSSNVAKGRTVVINAPGRTVRIAGNITYTPETLNNIGNIPQVLIIAKDILIAGSVTRVDAWLVASGKINTCSDVDESASLSVDLCHNPLTVNGPVMADKLFLRRTAGSGTGASSGDPAEIFNLRADAYLWSVNRSLNLGRAQTVFNTELPPRF